MLGGTSPDTVSFSLAAQARCEHRAQEKVSTNALQVRDVGIFQQCPTDLHLPETPFYKSAAVQLGGERRALSSAGVKASFMCVHTYTLPLAPSCCHRAKVSRRGAGKWVRATPCCPHPLLQWWPWMAACTPDVGNSPRTAVAASPEGRVIAARAEGDREREARASAPFPVPEASCSCPGPAAFSPNLPPPLWLSFLGASQPHDATLGCVWT